MRPTWYPRSALPVWTLMPTMSPGWMVSGTICSSDSSTRIGSPASRGVAAASTNSHRGVMTAVPKELSLGLTRCTLIESNLSSCEQVCLRERFHDRKNRLQRRASALSPIMDLLAGPFCSAYLFPEDLSGQY